LAYHHARQPGTDAGRRALCGHLSAQNFEKRIILMVYFSAAMSTGHISTVGLTKRCSLDSGKVEILNLLGHS